MSSTSTSPVTRLLPLLHQHQLTAYIVLSDDAHASEYVADCDKRREFISGFTGSAGTALIINNELLRLTGSTVAVKHRLWTDGRYWTQAEQELSPEWELMRSGAKDVPKLEDFLIVSLPPNSTVAVDASTINVKHFKQWSKALKTKGMKLKAMDAKDNLIDQVWGSARPPRPQHKITSLPLQFTGRSVVDKLSQIRQQFSKQQCSTLILSALDEIAYIFNLRGSDIQYNPVFFSYATITDKDATLYIDSVKVDETLRKELKEANVGLKAYEALFEDAKTMVRDAKHKVWIDSDRCSQAIYSSLLSSITNETSIIDLVYEAESPIQLMKACKNETEVRGMKNAHINDAIAECEFLCWLEHELTVKNNTSLDECSAADKLEEYRSKQLNFVGLSFDTISSIGSNAAIIHYKANPKTCKKLTTKQVYLLDSGGQYLDGTTDITRTMHFGSPSEYEKECFTLVLKGHIQLAMAVFPQGTVGPMVDAFARQALWANGLDYQHGTGHGVGCYLNVHEGPMGISSSVRAASVANTPLAPGMCLSNEPGFYEPGKFGIRIESIFIVVKKHLKYNYPKDKQYFGFETITLVPIQQKMINKDMLSQQEKDWLNDYHTQCRDKIGPKLSSEARAWLERETQHIN